MYSKPACHTGAFWLLIFSLLLFPSTALPSTPTHEKPNIVIILADDMGWADVGYHADRVETPNIDALAAEGIELNRFYVAPMCSPTRAGLLTGRYPIRFGMARAVIPPFRNFGLPIVEHNIAEALAGAGYKHRGVFGKWHLGHLQGKWHPLAQGFTHFEGHYNGAINYFTHERQGEHDWHVDYEPVTREGYATDLIADAAVNFIRTNATDTSPYFIYIAFLAPHAPLQAKPEDLARYVKEGVKASSEQTVKAMIWSLDQGVGRILEAIEQSSEAENTQVWFISDNGGTNKLKSNNLPLRGNKLTTFEGGIRVPAVVRWPAVWQGNRTIENTVGYIDVFPTVLQSAKLDSEWAPPTELQLDGDSLHGLLTENGGMFPERDWYSYHGQNGLNQEFIAIKTAEWKLVVEGPDLRRGEISGRHRVLLFKMPEDSLEQHDLSEQHPEVIEELTSKLISHRELQPSNAVPPYNVGKEGFVPPSNWQLPPKP
jgi:arylsulfatase B